jgi:uncharacterized protein (TIGR02996 family)
MGGSGCLREFYTDTSSCNEIAVGKGPMSTIDAFLLSITQNPHDASQWLILSDFLEESSDEARAELVRLQYDLRQPGPLDAGRRTKEGRMHALLAAGAQRCVPRLVNSITMPLLFIPPGSFWMGAPDSELQRDDDELPQREVKLTRAFYLGVYPVTQREYEAVMGENPASFNESNGCGPEHPVEMVSWEDAVAFCARLSDRPAEKAAGRTYRLPTEAEWEYACRAGTSTPFFFGATATTEEVNFDGNYPYGGTTPGKYLVRSSKVGSYAPNPWGLFDMHGNIEEWCADKYDDHYYAKGETIDPLSLKGRENVVRGGCWFSYGRHCRSANRNWFNTGGRNYYYGFRVALTVPAEGP